MCSYVVTYIFACEHMSVCERFLSSISLHFEKGSLIELEIADLSNLASQLILDTLSLPPEHWVYRQATLPT